MELGIDTRTRQLSTVFAAVGRRDDEENMKGGFVSRGRLVEVSDSVLSDEGHGMQDTMWVRVQAH
jgi:hypothetical protein